MHNILIDIIKKEKKDIEERKKTVTFDKLRGVQSEKKNGEFLFRKAMSKNGEISLIAEVKFASPTSPFLGSPDELLKRVKQYEKAGADGISIITEEHYFKGDKAFVSQVKEAVRLPILQKDFVIDPYQIYEARQIGSDALLLIARLVELEILQQFVDICIAEGIEPVVEINNKEDLEKAIATKTNIIAVNARNLETFAVDVSQACSLMGKIPSNFIKLGFSGIHSSEEVAQYRNAGAKGILVGTSLMTAKDIQKFLISLRSK